MVSRGISSVPDPGQLSTIGCVLGRTSVYLSLPIGDFIVDHISTVEAEQRRTNATEFGRLAIWQSARRCNVANLP